MRESSRIHENLSIICGTYDRHSCFIVADLMFEHLGFSYYVKFLA